MADDIRGARDLNPPVLSGYSSREYQEDHAQKIYLDLRNSGTAHLDAIRQVKELVYSQESEKPEQIRI